MQIEKAPEKHTRANAAFFQLSVFALKRLFSIRYSRLRPLLSFFCGNFAQTLPHFHNRYFSHTFLFSPNLPLFTTQTSISMSTHFTRKILLPEHHVPSGPRALSRKRRSQEEDPSSPRSGTTPIPNRKAAQLSRFKKIRTPRVRGQSLPVLRLLEVLDQEALKGLLQTVMTHHPEIVQTVVQVAPKPSAAEAVDLIRQKAAALKAHLPYKCDVESDYSYIRVKPYLTELFSCMSDFILAILPPMESFLQTSITTMDSVLVTIHELPDFSNKEFQYTKTMAFEQIAELWLTLLKHHRGELVEDAEDAATPHVVNAIEWAKTIEEMRVLELAEKHNELSGGKLQSVVDYVRAELDAFEQHNHALPSVNASTIFGDLITMDYSNYSMSARTSH